MGMRSTWLDLRMDQVQINAGLRLSFEYPHDDSVFFINFVDLPFYDFFFFPSLVTNVFDEALVRHGLCMRILCIHTFRVYICINFAIRC
jgi:hypothetical protein